MSKNQSGEYQVLNNLKSFNKKSDDVKNLILEALTILNDTGIPFENFTERGLEKMAMSFLAVANVNTKNPWREAKGIEDNFRLGSREIINYINEHFEENISSGSYDDIRRKDLKLLTIAEFIIKAAGKIEAATNDPSRKYALSKDFKNLIIYYNTPNYPKSLKLFMRDRETLAEVFKRNRNLKRISVSIPSGEKLSFSAGLHNDLQKAIIEEFLPIFAPGCELLYVGDTSNKMLFYNKDVLSKLNFFELSHDELPDILAYLPERNWLFLIEAVHSSGPLSEVRIHQLKKLLSACPAEFVFVTAFLNRETFKTWASQIAWETEVWIADNPEHLIHFNGDKFLGPYIQK